METISSVFFVPVRRSRTPRPAPVRGGSAEEERPSFERSVVGERERHNRRWPLPLTRRWLVRFGYDGVGFSGWARQPGTRTVEGVIRAGLSRHGSVFPPPIGVEVASRTDRGVSARANALTLWTALDGPPLLRALNGISAEIFFTAAAPVASEFRVRHAVERTYRYYLPRAQLDRPVALPSWRSAARLFEGPVDVRSFGRGVPVTSPRFRPVHRFTVRAVAGGLVLEVRAPSFVWGMVRKMVGALQDHHDGRLSLDRLAQGVAGTVRLSLPLAPPEGLVLWNVEHGVRWTHRWEGPNRHQERVASTARAALWTRHAVLGALPGR